MDVVKVADLMVAAAAAGEKVVAVVNEILMIDDGDSDY